MPPLKPFKPGQALLASDLNKIVNSIISRITSGPGVTVHTFGKNVVISMERGSVVIAPGKRMQVQSDEGDYLICRTLDAAETVGPSDIFVMKPWLLRRTPFENKTVNGVAYTYSANGTREADATEIQKITQDYYAGAEITVITVDIPELVAGIYSKWIDMNESARAWAVE